MPRYWFIFFHFYYFTQHVKNYDLYLKKHLIKLNIKYIHLPLISLDSDSLSVCSNSQSIPKVSGDSNEGFNSISKYKYYYMLHKIKLCKKLSNDLKIL